MPWLLLLFIGLPLLELAFLIEVGSRIGTFTTIALLVGSGVLGATLARAQGLGTLNRLRDGISQGKVPAGPLVDGAIILVSAALLLTPGLLTDLIGLLGLLPPVRAVVRNTLWRRVERSLRVRFHAPPPASDPKTFDAEFERRDRESNVE